MNSSISLNNSNSLGGSGRRKATIGLTSLIDVVFILLLFFMLSSTFSPQSALNIQSASSGAAAVSNDAKPLLIHVVDDNTLRINGELCNIDTQCLSQLSHDARANAAKIGLRAEGSATIQALVSALSTLEENGFQGVQLLESTEASDVR